MDSSLGIELRSPSSSRTNAIPNFSPPRQIVKRLEDKTEPKPERKIKTFVKRARNDDAGAEEDQIWDERGNLLERKIDQSPSKEEEKKSEKLLEMERMAKRISENEKLSKKLEAMAQKFRESDKDNRFFKEYKDEKNCSDFRPNRLEFLERQKRSFEKRVAGVEESNTRRWEMSSGSKRILSNMKEQIPKTRRNKPKKVNYRFRPDLSATIDYPVSDRVKITEIKYNILRKEEKLSSMILEKSMSEAIQNEIKFENDKSDRDAMARRAIKRRKIKNDEKIFQESPISDNSQGSPTRYQGASPTKQLKEIFSFFDKADN